MAKRLALDIHPGKLGVLVPHHAICHGLTMVQEGLATVVIAFAAYWFIQNYPDTAPFLSTKERAFIQARLSADSDATHNEQFTWENVTKALKDPKCWLYGLAFHTTSLPLYTFSLFIVSVLTLTPSLLVYLTDNVP